METSATCLVLAILLYTISAPPATCSYALKKCIATSLDGAMCPPNSHCSQQRGDGDYCVCEHTHIVNALYTSDDDYCLMDYTTIATPSAEEESVQREAAPSETPHHHIIGGILIPLFLVSAFVSGAYLVVRYRVFQRIRERVMGRRRRRRRPTYQDVMLGTEFDPPLI